MSKKRSRVDDDDEDVYEEEEDIQEDEEDYEYDPHEIENDDMLTESQSKERRLIRKQQREREIEKINGYIDYSYLNLKPDHMLRPIYVTRDYLIILEAFSPIYAQAYDFLVAIAEPESRPEYIHRYRLTQNSLYAAVAVGIDSDSIIKVLNKLCKTEIPHETLRFIKNSTRTFGQAKLILKNNQYYIESSNADVLRELLRYEVIQKARVYTKNNTNNNDMNANATVKAITNTNDGFEESISNTNASSREIIYNDVLLQEAEDDDEEEDLLSSNHTAMKNNKTKKSVTFMIEQSMVEDVKRVALHASYPLLEEYDFRADKRNPSLTINIKASTRIRVS